MNKKEKSNLKQTGYIFLIILFVIIIFIFCSKRESNFYTLTTNTLINNSVFIYDRKLNIVGDVSYKLIPTGLCMSINGGKIMGEKIIYIDESFNRIKEPYEFDTIQYENINMVLKTHGNENYYYYDTGSSVILLCLLQPWFINNSSLEKLAKKKNKYGFMMNKQVFIIAEIDYEEYEFYLRYFKKTLQNGLICETDTGKGYECFFIQ